MKILNKAIIGCLLAAGLTMTSCDYLNVIPDETTTGADIAKDRQAALNYLYSCYGFLPTPNAGPTSLDFLTGDEVVTAFEHELFAGFPKGNYSASNPVISYWNTLYQGIRQCYMFQDELNKGGNFKGLEDKDRNDYKAQMTFLIGYYHFLLSRCYGPIIVVHQTPDPMLLPENYQGQEPYDDCVNFICEKFDEAAKGLPATRTGAQANEFGLATSVVAKAMKAKMLLYAASPLFNGNSKFYSDFKDKSGNALMPLTYDATKWQKAADAFKEAIAAAESAGYHLYDRGDCKLNKNGYPADPNVRALRYTITDYSAEDERAGANPEVIWADSRGEGYYGLQNKSIPYIGTGWGWNGVAPTVAMLSRFYTKNGLPIDQDKTFDYADRWEPVEVDEAHEDEAYPGRKTPKFNLDREPRYYAWIAFQDGYYEILSAANNGAYKDDPNYNLTSDNTHGRLVCDFVVGGNCSRGTDVNSLRNSNYSPTGFLNKKFVNPDLVKSKTDADYTNTPWPLIRLAELYLGYAECLVETGDLQTARTYLDKVRTRAGLPGVKEAWEQFGKDPAKATTKEGLRDIVRNERMNEMYLENQNFWDMRRWLLAETYFNVKAKGMNIDVDDINDFCSIKEVVFERKFQSPMNYLMPIPSADINRNDHVVQTPGY